MYRGMAHVMLPFVKSLCQTSEKEKKTRRRHCDVVLVDISFANMGAGKLKSRLKSEQSSSAQPCFVVGAVLVLSLAWCVAPRPSSPVQTLSPIVPFKPKPFSFEARLV